MKNNYKIKQSIFAIFVLAFLSMPIAVSAQSIWDYFTIDYWISSTYGDKGDPNDDKKKKPAQPQPSAPTQEPAQEQCFEGLTPVPCPEKTVDN